MKKLLLATAATALVAGAASAEEVKIGVLLGFTGPLESTVPNMANGAELAMKEVSESGKLLDGATVTPVRGDTTCVDAAAAQSAAERLVTSDKVSGIVGGDCSGVTGAVLQNVARPNGIGMISPSATSPALSAAEDDGLFFRTAPSDARQGEVMADIISDRGVKEAAVTYTNNDYGKGVAESFQKAFEAKGGKVTLAAPHEDGKADYSAEIAALSSAGGEVLVVAGYVDQGGKGMIQAAVDSGAFSTFFLPDGMYGQSLIDAIGAPLNGSYGDVPGTDSPGAAKYVEISNASGFDGATAYSGESYDAAALMMLAMQAAGSTDSKEWSKKVFDVANGPGEQILPGELGKALDLIKEGKDIDYVGATAVELIGPGESAGNFREYSVTDGAFVTDKFR
ncbi:MULTISPECIES: ABC transporter substrate-binding protein [Gemmobacter]|jgi:branched-chain amino acid transport system substrate-binding protein|uniref:Amino acid/amide ABC transporter substrate-binding protein (HAAT family) n=2 Tax=Gemmobacter TaxID=204456 RepID=A0A2T6BAZ7_9RHOB|nr:MULTISPECIES: ABC transporter substrate-binding protein [Gemmobacter]OJY27204.1 MAG: branched-chain amino acid ABC transporter substrate-binding protein [Rhodobacterales bacterium 65-51]PTX53244.1 amino acid/amide ABC transporter substrate-binding protein (HAAT family) [Gemmobacter caeni]TWJ05355.1 amino acid/amide ABC transporter substrate-binding protein (HAAT family) [Gemmobacter caeni]GHC16495.1 branched-chain amino acid ABC transporter substrate-binding protein [Gemmobacter nanjingensis